MADTKTRDEALAELTDIDTAWNQAKSDELVRWNTERGTLARGKPYVDGFSNHMQIVADLNAQARAERLLLAPFLRQPGPAPGTYTQA